MHCRWPKTAKASPGEEIRDTMLHKIKSKCIAASSQKSMAAMAQEVHRSSALSYAYPEANTDPRRSWNQISRLCLF